MPCWEAFRAQDAGYRDRVLPAAIRVRVSVEAGVTMGWTEWIGSGTAVGIDRFGASAPGEVVLERLGMTVDAIVAAVERQLAR
jgi:transketolase